MRVVACLVLLAVAITTATASKCSDLGGVCGFVSACKRSGRNPIPNLCPRGADWQCCFEGEARFCASSSTGSGTCKVQGYQTCSGTFVSWLCPGPRAVKCCITRRSTPPSTGKGCSYWGKETIIPKSINSGLSYLSPRTLTRFFGKACSSPNTNCRNKGLTSPLIKNLVSSSAYPNIPFRVTMVRPAIEALNRIFSKVKAENPGLHAVIKDSGALCCRGIKRIDGSVSSTLSLHSWGVAVDLRVCAKPAARGANGKTYKGIIALAPYFQAEGFYWGAAFTDAMHFEVSSSLFARWVSSGALAK